MTEVPTYPLLVLGQGAFWVAARPNDVATATLPGLKRGSTMDAVDRHGNAWRITLTLAEPPGVLARILGTSVKVDANVEAAGKADLDQLMDRVCHLVANDPDDVYSQFVECGDLQTLVRESGDFGQLIKVVSTLGEASRFAR